ncbi:hypothetical protein HN682_04065 [Candidatus Peregrinibacteria bacterium]|jgi:phosphohistidine swiveling domain-containing protein|nr:hypothetical protein [Candidatus Peregrinibacteria bacterium]
MNLADLYKKQISLSEWFADINHEQTEAFRKEDNWKRKRMEELSEFIPFPFDKPTTFDAEDVVDRTPEFKTFLKEHGDEMCALRLIPKKEGLQKLRMRGMTISDVIEDWLPKQDIVLEEYQADFMPHPKDHIWSTIFVVNTQGIIGEIIAGGHNQLTQGFHDDEHEPIRFRYIYDTDIVETDPHNDGAEEHIRELISYICVEDAAIRQKLIEKFDAQFAGEYLCGYLETVESGDYGTWFIDWNRVLGKLYKDFWVPIVSGKIEGDEFFTGTVGSPGIATGIVRIVHPDNIESSVFNNGDILVCLMTSPDYVPLMKRAGAVITQEGGILSHAAIVSREMNVPCIVGVKDLLEELSDGDLVEVDTENGVVRKI